MKSRIIIITFILAILILIMISGCSIIYPIIYPNWLERIVGYNGICWYDNDHVLVYSNLTWYYQESTVLGNSTGMYKWQGELWKCNVNTGEKELMMRGNDYWIGDIEDARICVVNGNIYISDEFSTYKVNENNNGWDSITQIAYPIVSSDENYIVGVYRSNNDNENEKVIKFNMNTDISETIYTNSDLIEWLDYDYSRNYLLVDNRKFVNINTGEEIILVDNDTKIGKYTISSLYGIPPQYGNILSEYITMDIYLEDTLTDESKYRKIRISIADTIDKQVLENIIGVGSLDGTKYASGYPRSVLITDILGNLINRIVFDSDKL